MCYDKNGFRNPKKAGGGCCPVFSGEDQKGAIQMLKKIISAMLALTLALSLAGVV